MITDLATLRAPGGRLPGHNLIPACLPEPATTASLKTLPALVECQNMERTAEGVSSSMCDTFLYGVACLVVVPDHRLNL